MNEKRCFFERICLKKLVVTVLNLHPFFVLKFHERMVDLYL